MENEFGNFQIDLFTSNSNKKCSKFVSWKRDPESFATDAFTIHWGHYHFYAFPPFSLILRTLEKIIQDKAEGVVLVPNWPTQTWFPLFNTLLVNKSLILKPNANLLLCPFREKHPLAEKLSLVARLLSGKLF